MNRCSSVMSVSTPTSPRRRRPCEELGAASARDETRLPVAAKTAPAAPSSTNVRLVTRVPMIDLTFDVPPAGTYQVRRSGLTSGKTWRMLTVGTVVMGVSDLHRAIAFWTQALNYVPKREVTAEDDFMILVPSSGPGTHLALDVSGSA